MSISGSMRKTLFGMVLALWGNSGALYAQSQSYEDLRTAAATGDLNAQRTLGEALVSGKDGAPQNTEEGLAMLEATSNTGDIDAKASLGKLLLEGYLVPADPDRGTQLLADAIEAGNVEAQTTLGLALLWGVNREKDPVRANALLEEAAKGGDLLAVRVLGQNLLGGWVFEQDVERGMALLNIAGDAGDPEALVSLGNYYLNRSRASTDPRLALDYFERAADFGDVKGLADYGSALMWSQAGPADAEAYLRRAGEMGVGSAWTTLATGAMYGYLGRNSRSKYDDFAERGTAAGEKQIAVLDAQRQMWGISMRASGPKTLAGLDAAADAGNDVAAHYLISLVRDGNSLNIRKNPDAARAYLERFSKLLTPPEVRQLSFTIDASSTKVVSNFAALAQTYNSQPDLKSVAFGEEIYAANPNFSFFVLQQNMRDSGLYDGDLNGMATPATLRGVYTECRALANPERCNDTVMRADIIGALLAR